MKDMIRVLVKSTIKTKMIDKYQMHYIKKADEAESKGMFKEAIGYYSKAGSYSDVERLKGDFIRESSGRRTNLGIKRYLSAKREERLPEMINKNDLEYFSTTHMIEKHYYKN